MKTTYKKLFEEALEILKKVSKKDISLADLDKHIKKLEEAKEE